MKKFELTPEDVAKILEINGIMQIELKDIPGYIPTYDWNKMVADKFNKWKKEDENRDKTKDGRL